jgi:hypothetical protein
MIREERWQMSFEEACALKREIETDQQFVIRTLDSAWSLAQDRRCWYLVVLFFYDTPRRQRQRIQGVCFAPAEWPTFRVWCREQEAEAQHGGRAPTAKEIRAARGQKPVGMHRQAP